MYDLPQYSVSMREKGLCSYSLTLLIQKKKKKHADRPASCGCLLRK